MLEAPQPGSAMGGVRRTLQAEGAVVFVAYLYGYHLVHGSWLLFIILFLAPDLSFAAYGLGSRAGALAYNTVHSYAAPIALLAWGLRAPHLLPYALIWIAHIGLDRLLGFGLKYTTRFEDTHLGPIGKARRR